MVLFKPQNDNINRHLVIRFISIKKKKKKVKINFLKMIDNAHLKINKTHSFSPNCVLPFWILTHFLNTEEKKYSVIVKFELLHDDGTCHNFTI